LKQSKFIISSDLVTAPEDLSGDDPLEVGTESELRRLVVPDGQHAQRLDRVMASMIPEFSRSYLQQLIEDELVTVNAAITSKSSIRLRAGDQIAVELRPTPQTQAFKPETITLEVVFEDAHLMVINKPAGLVVHPAPGNWSGTLLNGLLARDQRACLLPRAGIVHRLDKDTSGLMVVARTRQAMDALVQQISSRQVSRKYLALGHRSWSGPASRQVESPVGRDPRNRLRMAVVDLSLNAGKTASTGIRLIQNGANCCLVECTLQTGRTHQIRVHMASLGHPLLGDVLYGGAPVAGMSRQALHAFHLAFNHPVTTQPMAFTAFLPADMGNAMNVLGLSYNGALLSERRLPAMAPVVHKVS
jgi:23S rRNA pseudouridine1911/1915/1917 synthase